MMRYVIVHCKHEGCYDYKVIQDIENNATITPVTINPPKVFFFADKEQACEFFTDYINDVDVLDPRCVKGEEINHLDMCTCGIIEFDEEGNTNLFYNRKNQIFLLDYSAQVFLPSEPLRKDIHNMNLTNKFIRKCKTLDKEQKLKYIELGKACEKSMQQQQAKQKKPVNIKNEDDSEED